MDTFFTLESLRTLGGHAFAIGILTQVVKLCARLVPAFRAEVPNALTQVAAVLIGILLQVVFMPSGGGVAGGVVKCLNGLMAAMVAMKGAEFLMAARPPTTGGPMLKSRVLPILALVALLVLPGCAAQTRDQSLIISGKTLAAAGNTFADTAGVMNTLYDQKVVSAEQYNTWARFGKRFQAAYPKLKDLWEKAHMAGDAAKEGELATALAPLLRDLATYSAQALEWLGTGKSAPTMLERFRQMIPKGLGGSALLAPFLVGAVFFWRRRDRRLVTWRTSTIVEDLEMLRAAGLKPIAGGAAVLPIAIAALPAIIDAVKAISGLIDSFRNHPDTPEAVKFAYADVQSMLDTAAARVAAVEWRDTGTAPAG